MILRVAKRALDHAVQYFQMGAGGDFRHHAAIGRMRFGLAEDDIGQDFARTGRCPRTTAAAVSSQLVSRPNIVNVSKSRSFR